MQVFKLCLTLLQRKLPILMIYVVVFLSVLFTVSANFSKSPEQAVFSDERIRIAVIAAESSPVIDGLKRELAKTCDFVTLKETPEAMQDALFFHAVSGILRIPAGFTQDVLAGREATIERITVPNSMAGMNLDMIIDQYLNTVRLHAAFAPDQTPADIVAQAEADLAVETPVEMRSGQEKAAALSFSAYYFNYLSYVFMSVLILGISALMIVFNKPDLRRRNACSPIPSGRVNVQFLMANLLFTFAVWLIMTCMFFVVNPDRSMPPHIGLFFANSLLYAFCAASVSYLIGISLKGDSAVSAASNVVSLGTSFLCGVFVPQSMLSSSVLRVAQFTPTYWYVRANNQLAETALSTPEQVNTFLSCLLVEAVFAVAFLVLALVVGKKRNIRVG